MADESDLVKGVRGWVEKQGYPLEMRVAAQFEKSAFLVMQSSYYLIEGQQPRELDVEAWFSVEDVRLRWQPTSPRTPGLKEANEKKRIVLAKKRADAREKTYDDDLYSIQAGVIVECKSGTQKRPWVAFTGKKQASLDELLSGHPMTDLAFAGFSKALAKLPPERMSLFAKPEHYAYSVVPASLGEQKESKADDGFDIAYSAVKKAAEASRHMVETVNAGYGSRMVSVCVPTVVVSTPLVECWLEDGELRFAERTSVVVQFSRPSPDGRSASTYVHVIHESVLPGFIESVRGLLDVAVEHYAEFVEVIRIRNRSKSGGTVKVRRERSNS